MLPPHVTRKATRVSIYSKQRRTHDPAGGPVKYDPCNASNYFHTYMGLSFNTHLWVSSLLFFRCRRHRRNFNRWLRHPHGSHPKKGRRKALLFRGKRRGGRLPKSEDPTPFRQKSVQPVNGSTRMETWNDQPGHTRGCLNGIECLQHRTVVHRLRCEDRR